MKNVHRDYVSSQAGDWKSCTDCSPERSEQGAEKEHHGTELEKAQPELEKRQPERHWMPFFCKGALFRGKGGPPVLE